MTLWRNQLRLRPFANSIDRCRALARVYRAGHQDHRAGHRGIVHPLHQRHGGEHRDGRLTDAHHMHVSPEKAQKINDVVDIRVEVERTVIARHEARVLPLGHVDLVVRKEIAHRAAKEGRVMTGERSHDQELGVPMAPPSRHVALEMDEIAEWLADYGAFMHGHRPAADDGVSRCPIPASGSDAWCARTFRARQQRSGQAACRPLGSAGCETAADRRQPRPVPGSGAAWFSSYRW